MKTKKKKVVVERIDGLGPKDIARLRSAIRKVWHWSYPKKLCTQRALDKKGFPFCEKCKKKSPKVFIDHIIQVGDLDAGYFERLFVSSKGLQALCRECHNAKTKAERNFDAIPDFY